ncbi:F0F1 ATP synthase subunit delta [Helicobacter jaachi]|uniref:F0F1 ATP synthase subunit delta n=1 Tax=Helicobacter jaachi TaxID=1677920 RepID=A0A4U8T8K2_9HELI|nr:F0F1 ATP synthase subunit delta [Helicobacter jaachi]TLD96030.1 F0F1 ATP synthase subunit delta [Helicobacter jaachi]
MLSIAKKYTQALINSSIKLDEMLNILKDLSSSLQDKKVMSIIASPFLNKTQKEQLLLESIGNVDVKIQNFFRLLVEEDRIQLIPYIAQELEKCLLARKKEYAATLVSKEELDSKTLDKIQASLAKKLGVKLSIKQKISGTDGIRLSVEDLGIEVSFSRERFSNDLKNHILKAL